MKAWVFNGTNKPLELKEVPNPTPAPGEIVIDIKACGLCHSDVSALDDPNWIVNFPNLPVVLGHEPVGVVTALGEGVSNLMIGDRVGIPSGPPNYTGYFRDGAYAEQTTAIANAVVKIPDSLDYIKAAAGTDAGNVSHHAVVTVGNVRPGEKVAIIGIGGLGMIGAQIAAVKGVELYVAEIKNEVCPIAAAMGAKKCVSHITELADIGLDTIIDFAGFGTTTNGAIQVVREYGKVIQVGMGKLKFEIDMNPLIIKQVRLLGSMGGGLEDLAGVWDLMASGALKPTLSTVTFNEINDGLNLLRQGTVTGRLVADMQNGI